MIRKQKPLAPKTFEGLSQYRPPLCYELTGKSYTLVMDSGYDYELAFTDNEKLSFGKKDEPAGCYSYDCLKADDHIYFVNFEMTGSRPRTGLSLVLDLEQDLVTFVFAYEGLNPKMPRLPSLEYVFGAILKPDGTLANRRHGFTADMVGQCIHWYYATLEVIHIYSSERYYRLALPESFIEKMKASGTPMPEGEAQEGHFFEEPASYIKIKDGIYLFAFVEELMARERGSGNSMLFVINMDRLHDVGRSFGYNAEGNQENYTFGAYGEPEPHPMVDAESIYWIR